MRWLVLLVVVLAAFFAARWSRHNERRPTLLDPPQSAQDDTTGKSVALAIDFGDEKQRVFASLPWHAGMTVDELLTEASRLPNGIFYSLVGDGDTMFLTEIDGVGNYRTEGRPFWTYRVNGQWADRSMATYTLAPGDHVEWTFRLSPQNDLD